MKIKRRYYICAIGITFLSLNFKIPYTYANTSNSNTKVINQIRESINIPDRKVRRCINEALGKENLDSNITKEEIESLEVLILRSNMDGVVSDLTGLEYAKNLKKLELASHTEVKDFYPITKLDKLESLKINGNYDKCDFKDFESVSNLKELVIYGNDIENMDKLVNNKNLEVLILSRVSNDIDMKIISKFTNLKQLELNSNAISNFEEIAKLSNLRVLSVYNENLDDLSPIKELVNLEKLKIQTKKVSDISSLRALTKLKELNLSDNNIDDISYLSNLTQLTTLIISNNNISNIDAVSKLVNLEVLHAYNNKIKDITPLGSLLKINPKLDFIFEKNSIMDMSPLKDSGLKDGFKFEKQHSVIDKVIIKNGKLKIKNPLKDIQGNIKTNIGSWWDSMGAESIVPKIEGEYLVWENIEYEDLVKSKFNLAVFYDIQEYPLEMGGSHCSKIVIPVDRSSFEFKDIKGHWAEAEIKKFVLDGYINGYNDITFRPQNNITRAEFVAIFNRYFALDGYVDMKFNDVYNHWAENDIRIAIANGVCKGVSATKFNPDAPITREESAQMISNYKKIADKNHDKINKYKDNTQVSSWAKDAVEGVIEKGYMNGYKDDTFKPKANITRAEAVVTLQRTLNN